VGASISFFAFIFGSSSSGDLRLFSWDYRASTVQGLDLSSSWWGIALGTFLLSLAVLPRAAGIVGLPAQSSEAALAAGLVIASVVPIWVLSQGVNELWFAVAAAAPLAVLSAVGLEGLWDRIGPAGGARMWAAVAVSAGLASASSLAVLWSLSVSHTLGVRSVGPLLPWLVGTLVAVVAGFRLGRPAGVAVLATALVVTAAVGRGVTAFGDVGLQSSTGRNLSESLEMAEWVLPSSSDQLPQVSPALSTGTPQSREFVESVEWSPHKNDAALWLRHNASLDEVLATDQPLSAMIPAVSAMTTYLSASSYQKSYGSQAKATHVDERLKYSQILTQGLTPELRAVLCDAGVDWLWIEAQGREFGLPVAFSNREVTIYSLGGAACTE